MCKLKNVFEKGIGFTKMRKMLLQLSIGIVIFTSCGADAYQQISRIDAMKQKIAQKSEQNLVAQKLRQEIQAYREKYSENYHKSNSMNELLINSADDNNENVLIKQNKFPENKPKESNAQSTKKSADYVVRKVSLNKNYTPFILPMHTV